MRSTRLWPALVVCAGRRRLLRSAGSHPAHARTRRAGRARRAGSRALAAARATRPALRPRPRRPRVPRRGEAGPRRIALSRGKGLLSARASPATAIAATRCSRAPAARRWPTSRVTRTSSGRWSCTSRSRRTAPRGPATSRCSWPPPSATARRPWRSTSRADGRCSMPARRPPCPCSPWYRPSSTSTRRELKSATCSGETCGGGTGGYVTAPDARPVPHAGGFRRNV